jgi:hypothetical protein
LHNKIIFSGNNKEDVDDDEIVGDVLMDRNDDDDDDDVVHDSCFRCSIQEVYSMLRAIYLDDAIDDIQDLYRILDRFKVFPKYRFAILLSLLSSPSGKCGSKGELREEFKFLSSSNSFSVVRSFSRLFQLLS